jgi:hypothetical protein
MTAPGSSSDPVGFRWLSFHERVDENMDDRERVISVTVQPTTLLDAAIVALESDEFRQIAGLFEDNGNGRCAWGVLREVVGRAGYPTDGAWFEVIDPDFVALQRVAATHLGFGGIDEANDAGVSLAEIGQALRAARDGGRPAP